MRIHVRDIDVHVPARSAYVNERMYGTFQVIGILSLVV